MLLNKCFVSAIPVFLVGVLKEADKQCCRNGSGGMHGAFRGLCDIWGFLLFIAVHPEY